MHQSFQLNPQVDQSSQSPYRFQSYKQNNLKNKPFWISCNKKHRNYLKSLTKQNQSIHSQLVQTQEQQKLINQSRLNQQSTNIQSYIDEQSYLQSVLSDNQNYIDDFQIYQFDENNINKRNKGNQEKIRSCKIKEKWNKYQVRSNNNSSINVSANNNNNINNNKKLPRFYNKSQLFKKHINNNQHYNQIKNSNIQNNVNKTPRLENIFIHKSRIIQNKSHKQSQIKTKHSKTQPIQQPASQYFPSRINILPIKSHEQQYLQQQRQFLLLQNPLYLKSCNQKLIRTIQQLRNKLPILIKNKKQLQSLKYQLSYIKSKIHKAVDIDYSYQIENNTEAIKQKNSMLINSIKKIRSPQKYIKIEKSIVNDQFYIDTMTNQHKIRQKLLNSMRITILRQNKINKLDQKIIMYQQILQKYNTQINNNNTNKIKSLQNRKIFLQWDIEKRKNDYDIQILQSQIQNRNHKDQIMILNNQINQIQKNLQQIEHTKYQNTIKKQQKQQLTITKRQKSLQQAKQKRLFNFSKNKFIFPIRQSIQSQQSHYQPMKTQHKPSQRYQKQFQTPYKMSPNPEKTNKKTQQNCLNKSVNQVKKQKQTQQRKQSPKIRIKNIIFTFITIR